MLEIILAIGLFGCVVALMYDNMRINDLNSEIDFMKERLELFKKLIQTTESMAHIDIEYSTHWQKSNDFQFDAIGEILDLFGNSIAKNDESVEVEMSKIIKELNENLLDENARFDKKMAEIREKDNESCDNS